MASEQMMVAALGRPFTLGMLYDARKDKLHAGFTLWDKKTLQENMSVHSQNSSAFEITASDSFDSKSSLLDVDASLRASFLGGLIEVEGSAKYLNDKKKFKNQSRVTLQYKATTTFKQLSMTHQEARNKLKNDVLDKVSATHVVTGILYGAHAFFVFDSEKLDSSSIQHIRGSMQAVIKKIPEVDIEGSIKLTDEEKALTNKFSCKFHGDFILESNPATFEDAVTTYIQLPKFLGQKKEIAVPLKVWLEPLKLFDLTALELKNEICIGLVSKAEDALEDLGQVEMRCNDSLEEKVVENVPEISKMLRKFQKLCNNYKSKLQLTMKKNFPLIREGKEEDISVKKVFEEREKSPFNNDNLNNWMKDKEREITVIKSCVEIITRTKAKMVPNQSEVDKRILAQGVEHALCFVFTSVERDDPYLEKMTNYLDPPGSHRDENVTLPTEDHWYTSEDILRKMREKAKTFYDVASNLGNNSRFTFIIAALPNQKYKGATIYHYEDGVLITEDFSRPEIPEVKTVTDQRRLIWYACELNLDPRTANNCLTLSDGNKKATYEEQQSYPDCPERFNERPAVLCKEGLTGRHYWEVEWSKCYWNDVSVAVTYQRTERKGNGRGTMFGYNDISWCFSERHNLLIAFHGNGDVWNGPVPENGYNRIGVYLDWPAGTLTFYGVTSNTLCHLYTFQSKFTDAVYPGFRIYQKSNYISLCPV